MAITTYVELQTAISTNWLRRSDLTSIVPDFIALAEVGLNYGIEIPELDLRVPGLRVRDMETRDSAFYLSQEYQTLPSDFLEMKSLRITGSDGYGLDPVGLSNMTQRYASSTTGKPIRFALVGSTVRLSPPPDATRTSELVYYAKIPASTTATPNWLLTKRPDIILYGSLVQAALNLNDSRLPVWAKNYAALVTGFQTQDVMSRYGGGALVRMPGGSTP